ncbi:MAG TPA: tetratricopeptide repeat protein [Terriglobales bacterium]|nr:tetratricopeptide repeat protein [Terriglobales bacterium]
MSLSEADTFAGISMPPLPPSDDPTLPPVPPRPAASSMNSMVTAGPWGAAVAPALDTVDFGPRYRIDRLLGQGGMGAVYKAYDKELDRPVALKLIRPDLATEPQAMGRFKQELLLASKISHKNILRIHDLGEANGVKFISMAYVHGQDLHGLLQRGRLTVDEALHIIRPLCGALEAAHSEGVVHRDLKPQNVLLDDQRNVFVTDFGLAKSLEVDTGMTMSGQYLGTPRYMAPEQVESHHNVDHRADLYALGLILYEMVTGDVPFHAETPLQLMYKRVHEAPRSPAELNPDLPPWLVQIIVKAIDRDPARRYQSARAMLNDIDAARAPSVVIPPPLDRGPETRQISIALPTWRKAVISGVVVVALLAAALVSWIALRNRALHRTSQASAPAIKHVAILPLKVLGDPKELGYIGEGVEDALSAKLNQLHDVSVASTNDVARIKLDQPLAAIGKSLGATFVVQGTLQGAGDKVRLVFTLDDVSSNKQLWNQEFSGVRQDLLTLEDQAYSGLLKALALKTTTDELARSTAHPTENVDAYELYLKGRNAMHGEVDAASVNKSVAFYEKAVQRDPAFALAYTGIADAGLRMYINTKDASWAQKALGAAQQAQALGDTLPEVHFALGSIYTATGKSAEAIAELTRALQLAPNSDEGYRRLGDAYRASGRKQEAIDAYQKAVAVNPYYWLNYNALGGALLRFGRNEEALVAYRKVTELAPKAGNGYINVGNVFYREGKWDEAIAAYQKAIEVDPSYLAYTDLGTTYFFLKRYPEAAQMFEKAVAVNPGQQLAMGNLADAYRWAGEKQKALDAYSKALTLAARELQVNPRDANIMAQMAQYYAKSGKTDQGLQYIRRARAIAPNEVSFMYFEGMVLGLSGKTPAAIAALRTALEKGYPAREAMNDPELNGLRSNPEFQSMLAQFGGK